MDDLDAAIAQVYSEPPSSFVAARSALVKELKAAKRKDDAATVAALRRPTKLAWSVGEAVRRAPEAAAAFFAAVDALAEPGGDLRRRTADLRTAVTALVDAVEGVAPGEATAALLATAADPDATAALRRGRLAEVPAAGGFGGLSPDVAEPAPPAEPDSGAEDVEHAEGDRREREARADAERAAAREAERAEAEEEAAATAQQLQAAQAAVEEADAALTRATKALDDARDAAASAAERLRAAEKAP